MTTYTTTPAEAAQEPLVCWTDYRAIAAIEGFDGEEHDEEELLEAWQHLINTGTAWRGACKAATAVLRRT